MGRVGFQHKWVGVSLRVGPTLQVFGSLTVTRRLGTKTIASNVLRPLAEGTNKGGCV